MNFFSRYRTAKLTLLLFLLAGSTVIMAGDSDHAQKRAHEIAAEVVKAMGGAEAYENTRFLAWNFFGRRYHVWDKHANLSRIEFGEEKVAIFNVVNRQGKVWEKGQEITDPEQLEKELKRAYESWINDSYWLVMPYKLRDPGVHLVYSREGKTEDGRAAQVLTMTFKEVGVTPDNKYEVFVDQETKLITQWAFFKKADDQEPAFITPWAKWQDFGHIKLSGDRGKAQLSNIGVYEQVPKATFEDPQPIKLSP